MNLSHSAAIQTAVPSNVGRGFWVNAISMLKSQYKQEN